MYKVIENPNPDKFIFPVGADKFAIVDATGITKETTSTLEKAQKRAEALNNPDDDDYGFFDEDTEIDYFANSGKAPIKEAEIVEEVSEKATFDIGNQVAGHTFQYKGTWYVATEDSAWLDAGDMEDGWDVSLPSDGYYTPCRIATDAEVKTHLEKVAEAHAAELGQFQIGQKVRRKNSGKIVTVLEIYESGKLKYDDNGRIGYEQIKLCEAVQ